jgi:hypothetical protein
VYEQVVVSSSAWSRCASRTERPAADVELPQPVDGPSTFKGWLEEHREGIHHIAVTSARPEDSEETMRHFGDL